MADLQLDLAGAVGVSRGFRNDLARLEIMRDPSRPPGSPS
jgi:hypothetical protein